ncbi:PAS domain-containing protein [Streptomyces sp. CC77]|uniref:PAS domain-containing protein n=1 Tax=Streptomyces sp. CC77 TaxID=1906739 RepID=UPI0008DE5B68|nr:PAS domain-containing protein [Streptomyces sp. CC77]OII68086.1 diguanylate cyclase [Streptomyces sp. CC77]
MSASGGGTDTDTGTQAAPGPDGDPGAHGGACAGPRPGAGQAGADLLATLLDGMDAALCAFDADGTVTHWNREAERILGWPADEAVGRSGLAGWAVRPADAADVADRLAAAMASTPERRVHECALLRKDGGRVLVRVQSAGVSGADGRPVGVFWAFGEVHTQMDFERSVALSEGLFADAPWGLVVVDADLRPAVVNAQAARALGRTRTSLLGRPLGDAVLQGVEQVEAALEHALAEDAGPRPPADLWVAVRTADGEARRCWRSGFVRLQSPLSQEPAPLGVAWLFQDVTGERLAEQDADRLRFRAGQLHRAGGAAAECEDPMEAATVHLDFALAGFADSALLDLAAGPQGPLVRAAASPAGVLGPVTRTPGAGVPVPYAAGHPALRALDRAGAVRVSAWAQGADRTGAGERWAAERQWPGDAAHALCAPLRSRGRTLGVVTFLRAAPRPAFARPDTAYAESVAARIAASVDLAQSAC